MQMTSEENGNENCVSRNVLFAENKKTVCKARRIKKHEGKVYDAAASGTRTPSSISINMKVKVFRRNNRDSYDCFNEKL